MSATQPLDDRMAHYAALVDSGVFRPSPVTSTRRSLPMFSGPPLEVTIISADVAEQFPTVYVDHSRDWIEVAEERLTASPAEVAAWFRAVADAIEAATTGEEPPC